MFGVTYQFTFSKPEDRVWSDPGSKRKCIYGVASVNMKIIKVSVMVKLKLSA